MNTNTIAETPPHHCHVCPWWLGYVMDNPLRRLLHPPNKVLGSYVGTGMTVLDFGCGFGHYSLGMARLVGPVGKVLSADIQQKMLDKVMQRATRAGLNDRIRPLLCNDQGLPETPDLDFFLASNSVHETPDPAAFMRQVFARLKPGGHFLMLEPPGHIGSQRFEAEVGQARAAGLIEIDRPRIIRQRTALLQKPEPAL